MGLIEGRIGAPPRCFEAIRGHISTLKGSDDPEMHEIRRETGTATGIRNRSQKQGQLPEPVDSFRNQHQDRASESVAEHTCGGIARATSRSFQLKDSRWAADVKGSPDLRSGCSIERFDRGLHFGLDRLSALGSGAGTDTANCHCRCRLVLFLSPETDSATELRHPDPVRPSHQIPGQPNVPILEGSNVETFLRHIGPLG